jgi:type IV pilus secretin PilQ/predicted competence protein
VKEETMFLKRIFLVILLLAMALPATAGVPDDNKGTALKILDLQYLESDSISRLVIRANLPFAYRAYAEDKNTLIIETEKADVSDIAPGITIGSRTIESIAVSTTQNAVENQATRIIIRHRDGQKYTVTPKGRRLFVDFGEEIGTSQSIDEEAESAPYTGDPVEVRSEAKTKSSVKEKADVKTAETSGNSKAGSGAVEAPASEKDVLSYRLDSAVTYDLLGIRVVDQGNDSAVILSTNQRMEQRLYRVVPVGGSPRFVVDLHGARHSVSKGDSPGVNGLFTLVRSAQFAIEPYPISRVVLDLENSEKTPKILARGNDLVILFSEAGEEKTESAQAEEAEIETSVSVTPAGEKTDTQDAESMREPETPERVEKIEPVVINSVEDAQPEPETAARTETESKQTVAAVETQKEAETPPEDMATADTPTSAEKEVAKKPKEEFKESVDLFEKQYPRTSVSNNYTTAGGKKNNPAAQQNQETTQPQERDVSVSVEDFYQTRVITAGEQRYTGKKVSLEFESIDLRALILLLGQMTDKNFIVDPSVRQIPVTITLRDVPWDQALDIILENNGLGKTEEGNVIRIATRAKLTQEADEKRRLASQQALAVPLRQVTQPVNYARARDLAGLIRRNLSTKGEVVVDERTNTLVITDIPTKVEEHLALVETLDIPTKQVIVEARIVETTRDFINEFGLQYGFRGSSTKNYGTSTGFIFPNEITFTGGGPEISPTGLPMAVNLPANTVNSSILGSFSNIAGSFVLDAILTSAESEKKVRVISRPRVSTQNNKRAEIKSGIMVPYQVIQNNTVSVQYREAMLKLEVTPQITADGTIICEVVVDKSSLGIATPAGYSIQKREATSNVLVKDGGVAVIGGVLELSDNLTQERTPLLSKIPIIGRLFQNRQQRIQNTELLIFISPRIIN